MNTSVPTGATTPIQRKLGNSWRGRNRYLDVCIDRKGEKGRGAGGGDSALVQRETNFAERTLCKFEGWIIVTSAYSYVRTKGMTVVSRIMPRCQTSKFLSRSTALLQCSYGRWSHRKLLVKPLPPSTCPLVHSRNLIGDRS